MNLLKRLLPAPFLLEDVKSAKMFFHDRLFRIQHQAVNSCHKCLRSCDRWVTIPDPDPYGNHRDNISLYSLTYINNPLYLLCILRNIAYESIELSIPFVSKIRGASD